MKQNETNKKQEAKINCITADIEELIDYYSVDNIEYFLGMMSSIICQLDTDIAIGAMERLGEEGKKEAHAIKVNYGY